MTTTAQNNAQEMVQTQAVERLVSLLEHAPAYQTKAQVRTVRRGDRVSQMARLRKAHAHYALSTMDDMVRVNKGAWLRRRYN